MKTLFTNARIIDPFGKTEFIENGYILIEDETIIDLGGGSASDIVVDETINLHGKTILPGMINAHTHLYSALAMGMPPPKNIPTSFVEVLKEVWWKLDLALDKDSVRASFESGLLECLNCGVTTIFDHHSSPNFTDGSLDLLVDIAMKFGQNISTSFEITDRNGKELFKSGLKENIKSIEKFNNNKYVSPLIGLHASFTLSDKSLQYIYNELQQLDKWGIHIHVAEDIADVQDAKSRGYESVIDRLNKFKLINENSFIIHGIYTSKKDINLLSKLGATLVHNPSSNANNRVGMLPNEHISKLNAGLGTDGMRANMLEEAQQGTLIRSSHLAGSDSSVNYLELLFKNNPRIASKVFSRKIGHLSVGNQADLAIFDYNPRTAITSSNFAGHILFGMSIPSDVVIKGKFRKIDNQFTDLASEEIVTFAAKQSKRLWQSMIDLV